MNTEYERNVACLIIQNITEPVPIMSFDVTLKLPENGELSYDVFNFRNNIGMLLNVDA